MGEVYEAEDGTLRRRVAPERSSESSLRGVHVDADAG